MLSFCLCCCVLARAGRATHDDFNDENVSVMAGSGYEQEGFGGEGSLDEKLEQDGYRDGRQNHFGEVFKGLDVEVEISRD